MNHHNQGQSILVPTFGNYPHLCKQTLSFSFLQKYIHKIFFWMCIKRYQTRPEYSSRSKNLNRRTRTWAVTFETYCRKVLGCHHNEYWSVINVKKVMHIGFSSLSYTFHCIFRQIRNSKFLTPSLGKKL